MYIAIKKTSYKILNSWMNILMKFNIQILLSIIQKHVKILNKKKIDLKLNIILKNLSLTKNLKMINLWIT